jgi:hypothetical protein
MDKFKFEPAKYGFHDVVDYPELDDYFGNPQTYVKCTSYHCNGREEFYWYTVITDRSNNLIGDDRFEIYSGVFTKGKRITRNEYPRTVYLGLINSEEFAYNLLTNLFGTLKVDSVTKEGILRLNSQCLYIIGLTKF